MEVRVLLPQPIGASVVVSWQREIQAGATPTSSAIFGSQVLINAYRLELMAHSPGPHVRVAAKDIVRVVSTLNRDETRMVVTKTGLGGAFALISRTQILHMK